MNDEGSQLHLHGANLFQAVLFAIQFRKDISGAYRGFSSRGGEGELKIRKPNIRRRVFTTSSLCKKPVSCSIVCETVLERKYTGVYRGFPSEGEGVNLQELFQL